MNPASFVRLAFKRIANVSVIGILIIRLASSFGASVCAVVLIPASTLASKPVGSGAFCTNRMVPPREPEP
jgi:hypothetical protein